MRDWHKSHRLWLEAVLPANIIAFVPQINKSLTANMRIRFSRNPIIARNPSNFITIIVCLNTSQKIEWILAFKRNERKAQRIFDKDPKMQVRVKGAGSASNQSRTSIFGVEQKIFRCPQYYMNILYLHAIDNVIYHQNINVLGIFKHILYFWEIFRWVNVWKVFISSRCKFESGLTCTWAVGNIFL